MPHFVQPALEWDASALEPVISKATIDTHYGKHHKAYVDKLNALKDGTKYAELELEEIVLESSRDAGARAIFNNAAQVLNHNLYWQSLKPGGGAPSKALAAKLQSDLGGLDKFKDAIVKKGVGHFASGWVWLSVKDGKLGLIDTHDADTALLHGHAPLLVLDVWEHAYYIDYRNERERHLRSVVNEVLNWDGASAKFERAVG